MSPSSPTGSLTAVTRSRSRPEAGPSPTRHGSDFARAESIADSISVIFQRVWAATAWNDAATVCSISEC
jgi:hypothetical protein